MPARPTVLQEHDAVRTEHAAGTPPYVRDKRRTMACIVVTETTFQLLMSPLKPERRNCGHRGQAA
jgi:hypothetical protein